MPQAITGVPGIDISGLEARKPDISKQLMQAAEGIGFFYVTGLEAENYLLHAMQHCDFLLLLQDMVFVRKT